MSVAEGDAGPPQRVLRDKAMQLQSTEESRHDAQSVAQIKDFVKKLGSLQTEKKALQVHINVAEQIGDHAKAIDFGKTVQVEQDIIRGEEANACMEYVEECSYRQVELRRLLRLACLSSLTSNGMKQKPFDALRREILQSYGYEALFTLANLETVGLFRRNGGPPGHCNNGNWSSVKRALKLFVEDDQAQVLPPPSAHPRTHPYPRAPARTHHPPATQLARERDAAATATSPRAEPCFVCLQTVRPNDIGYVYGGYAPLSVRLVQLAMGLLPSDGGRVNTTTTTLGNLGRGIAGATGIGARDGSGWGGHDDILPGGPSAQAEQEQPGGAAAVAGGSETAAKEKVRCVAWSRASLSASICRCLSLCSPPSVSALPRLCSSKFSNCNQTDRGR